MGQIGSDRYVRRIRSNKSDGANRMGQIVPNKLDGANMDEDQAGTEKGKTPMPSYCQISRNDPVHGPYHDHEHGFPTDDNRVLFERLAMEIHQAGLSWRLILQRRQGLRQCWGHFDPHVVAAFTDSDRNRLIADPRAIRNRLKIDAIIHNAKVVRRWIDTHGSLHGWIRAHHPRDLDQWTILFKKHLRFIGPTIVHEFLVGTAVLPGGHDKDCPLAPIIAKLQPLFLETGTDAKNPKEKPQTKSLK